MALVEALAEGLIDVVGSFHTPQDEEEKRLPFEEAASGAVGLETLLPAAMQLVHGGHLGAARPLAGAGAQPGAAARPAGRAARGGRAGRPRAVRPRHAVRARPRDAALEVEEHPLRPAPDAGAGAAHLGGRARGLRGGGRVSLVLAALLGYLLGSIPFGVLITRGARPRRHQGHRLGQHRRHQRAPDRQQGRRRRDAAARRRQRGARRPRSPARSPASRRRWSRASRRFSGTSTRSGWGFAAARGSRPSSASCWRSPGLRGSPPARPGSRPPSPSASRRWRRWSPRPRVRSGSLVFGRPDAAWLGGALAAFVFFRHAANIRRLLAGTEPRIGRGR